MLINVLLTVSYGRQVDKSHSYNISREGTISTLVRLNSYKDLGVIFQSDMSFKEHIASQINKASSMLGIIKRNFKKVQKRATKLITSLKHKSCEERLRILNLPLKFRRIIIRGDMICMIGMLIHPLCCSIYAKLID